MSSRMKRRWQHDSPSNAAQLRLASDDAAQLSSLPGSAEQRADEGCRRARDGKLYTRAQFHAHYGFYLGEEHWQKALDELIQRDGYRPETAFNATAAASMGRGAS